MKNNIKYLENAFSKSGTLFKDTSLEAVLKYCLTLPIHSQKSKYGSIFIYDSDSLGEHPENEVSTGIILIDIDHISKQTAKTIYESFDNLANVWNSLLAIQYSSSFYIGKDGGLHIYVLSDKLDKYEYKKQSQICLAVFTQLVQLHLNIDISKNIDFHNTNLYQRFNLYYSTFKYNEDSVPFDLNIVTFEDLEKLVIKYNLQLDTEIKRVISPVSNNMSIGDGKRLKIDRHIKIGPYRGNDIRFRISIIADKLFNDNAKSFCDKFFYYENNKSIYSHYPAGNTINPLIYKWLVENNYIRKENYNIIENWISEYSDQILYDIKRFNHLQIVAPTGTGKTTFVNTYLAKKLNAIVIVPFNVTNRLYDQLFEINSLYVGKVPKNKPVVMIWDQAIKRWGEIKDRYIIIDESHTLFLDRTYRDSAVKLILRLRETNCRCTFISATPAGQIFNDTKTVKYYKKRNMISLNINYSQSIQWSQYNYIKKSLDNNWYDKIILLDDSTAKKIYEQFIVNGYETDISYIRSSTKDSNDFIDLRENEMLVKKLTICTCIAFNGLNFKNENEKILVVSSIRQGYTTSNEIIQQIGRVRNSTVHALYFYDKDKLYENDIDDKEKRAKEKFDLHLPDFISLDYRYLNSDYIQALKEIESYLVQHSNLDKIVEELSQTNYISGYINDKVNDIKLTMNLALKKKESDEIKQDILNGLFLDKEYESEYQKQWSREINRLISNENISGVTIETFIDMINKAPKKKLIDTSINNIKEIVRVLNIDEKLFEYVLANKEKYVSMLSDSIDRKKFIGRLKKSKEIKDKYQNKIRIVDNVVYLDDIIVDIIEQEELRQKNQIERGKEVGSNNRKQVQDLETGKIYACFDDCAKEIRKSKSYVSKHKERFKIISNE